MLTLRSFNKKMIELIKKKYPLVKIPRQITYRKKKSVTIINTFFQLKDSEMTKEFKEFIANKLKIKSSSLNRNIVLRAIYYFLFNREKTFVKEKKLLRSIFPLSTNIKIKTFSKTGGKVLTFSLPPEKYLFVRRSHSNEEIPSTSSKKLHWFIVIPKEEEQSFLSSLLPDENYGNNIYIYTSTLKLEKCVYASEMPIPILKISLGFLEEGKEILKGFSDDERTPENHWSREDNSFLNSQKISLTCDIRGEVVVPSDTFDGRMKLVNFIKVK